MRNFRHAALVLGLTALAWASKDSLPVHYGFTTTSTTAEISVTFDEEAQNVRLTATGVHGLSLQPVLVTRAQVHRGETVKVQARFTPTPAPAAVALRVEGEFYGVASAENRSFALAAYKASVRNDGPYKTVPVNVTR